MATNEYILRRPEYYDDFHCIGNECLDNCCHDWRYIDWSDEEHDKLMQADMSDELRSKLQNAFIRIKNPAYEFEHWTINEIGSQGNDARKVCPLLTEGGLCSVHRELGEEYLSHICRSFPRACHVSGNTIIDACSNACPEIISTLMNSPDAMKMSKRILKNPTEHIRKVSYDGKNDIAKQPILRYRNEIVEFLYELIANEKYPVETGMVLGAVAAKRISALVQDKEFDRIPNEIKLLRTELNKKAQIDQINDIKPNYKIRLGVMGDIFMQTTEKLNISGSVSFSAERYDEGRSKLAELLKGREFFIRNLYLNTLICMDLSHFKNVDTLYDFYLLYCACCSISSLVCTTAVLAKNDPEDRIKTTVAALNRLIGHSTKFTENLLKQLKENNCTSTAHIALMLK